MARFTAFCQEAGASGTIWIATVDAVDTMTAMEVARDACAADWEYDRSHVHVLGIAEGDVNILTWEDQGDD